MFLSVRCLEEAFVKFPYLRKTLWKVVAIRTVTPLYQDRIEYQVKPLVLNWKKSLSFRFVNKIKPKWANWSNDNAFVSGTGGLRFKSRTSQIRHSVVNGLPPLRHFFERSCVARRCTDAKVSLVNSLHASVRNHKQKIRDGV